MHLHISNKQAPCFIRLFHVTLLMWIGSFSSIAAAAPTAAPTEYTFSLIGDAQAKLLSTDSPSTGAPTTFALGVMHQTDKSFHVFTLGTGENAVLETAEQIGPQILEPSNSAEFVRYIYERNLEVSDVTGVWSFLKYLDVRLQIGLGQSDWRGRAESEGADAKEPAVVDGGAAEDEPTAVDGGAAEDEPAVVDEDDSSSSEFEVHTVTGLSINFGLGHRERFKVYKLEQPVETFFYLGPLLRVIGGTAGQKFREPLISSTSKYFYGAHAVAGIRLGAFEVRARASMVALRNDEKRIPGLSNLQMGVTLEMRPGAELRE